MRTNEPSRAFTSPSARLTALAAITAAMGLAACADSLRLDVGTGSTSGSGGSGASGSTGGTGGTGGGSACTSNAQCAYPTPVCDTSAGSCVQCLVISECAAQPGTVCSLGACVCPTTGESFCAAKGGQGDRCVDLATSSNDCGSCGHACFGACEMGKCTDKWEPTSTIGAPDPRTRHVAVSTGTQMIVWGGTNGSTALATGGIYDLATHTWTATSLADSPSPRIDATAIWDATSNRMLIWGGSAGGVALGTGASFDPAKNAWTALPSMDAPSPRSEHTAVWTGSKMIIWGGTAGPSSHLDDGGVFDPVMGLWTPIPGGTGPSARGQHTAVWNDKPNQTHTMIIFGGFGYDPLPMTEDNYLATGGIFDPAAQPGWGSTNPGPPARARHASAWAGDKMIVYGGFDGSTPRNDCWTFEGGTWADVTDPTHEPRQSHTTVWIPAVTAVLVWGGDTQGGLLNTGYKYDPVQAMWSSLPTAPAARSHHTAVVDGSSMIIWGGNVAGGVTNTGAIFDATP